MNHSLNGRPLVAIVGDVSQHEVDEVAAPLADTADWTHLGGVASAIECLANASLQPELIVLLQQRPGEIGEVEVRRLQSAAPLAGMYAVLGSWCEGETRTGQPSPGVARIYRHDWPIQCRAELSRRTRCEVPHWSLPFTVSMEERFLDRCRPLNSVVRAELIAVVAGSRETAIALADACRSAGLSVASKPAKATAILWDTTIEMARDAKQVAAIKANSVTAPVIALVSYPRKSDCQKMLAAGVDAVLTKPFLLDDLLAEIERLTATR